MSFFFIFCKVVFGSAHFLQSCLVVSSVRIGDASFSTVNIAVLLITCFLCGNAENVSCEAPLYKICLSLQIYYDRGERTVIGCQGSMNYCVRDCTVICALWKSCLQGGGDGALNEVHRCTNDLLNNISY